MKGHFEWKCPKSAEGRIEAQRRKWSVRPDPGKLER